MTVYEVVSDDETCWFATLHEAIDRIASVDLFGYRLHRLTLRDYYEGDELMRMLRERDGFVLTRELVSGRRA